MASLIAFDLLRFRSRRQSFCQRRARFFRMHLRWTTTTPCTPPLHPRQPRNDQVNGQAFKIVVGRACAPRRLVDPVRRARADARDRLQTVRPTRAFDPQAYCPPRLAAVPLPQSAGAVRHLNRLRRQPSSSHEPTVVVSTHDPDHVVANDSGTGRGRPKASRERGKEGKVDVSNFSILGASSRLHLQRRCRRCGARDRCDQ